jgi:hypothetical protein
MLGGTLTAQAKFSGTGVTGTNLQQSLAGQFDVTSTNLNLSVANIRNPVLKEVVNVIGLIPSVIQNPAAAVGSALSYVENLGKKPSGSGQQGGVADTLAKSPINSVIMHGNAGSGRVNVQQAVVQSPAFLASVTGVVNLDPVLTNSTINFPVSVSLSRPLAQKLALAPANAPTNEPYVKLPDFLTETGTLGNPKSQKNWAPLLQVAGTAATGGKAAGVLGAASSLFGGGSSGTSSNTNTNPPATNQPSPKNLLKGLFK